MSDKHIWVVVLAAGDGRRVSALTADDHGRPVPKQYSTLGGEEPMLRWAIARARGVAPMERVVVVVAEQHRRFWEKELTDLPPENIVVQPRNRGTAAGVLLAFLHVFLRGEAQARLLILPSDHYVANEHALRRSLLQALRASRGADNRVLLLGMTATDCDPEYGWVLPAGPGPIGEVARFIEKPGPETARGLMQRGALVNSFMLVAQASALLRAYEEALPGMLRVFLGCLRGASGPAGLERLYELIPNADLCRDVFERVTRCLSVVRVPPCGWSDLGTPARIQLFLTRRHARRPAGRAVPAGTATGEPYRGLAWASE